LLLALYKDRENKEVKWKHAGSQLLFDAVCGKRLKTKYQSKSPDAETLKKQRKEEKKAMSCILHPK
jgi:hypothetical protein